MSCFLNYFEINNPNTDWKVFNQSSETIEETFGRVKSEVTDINLNLTEINTEYNSKSIKSFILSDGVSSDRIFSNKKNADRNKNFTILFLEERIKIGKYILCFMLTLQENQYFDLIKIDKRIPIENISLNNLRCYSELEKEILYMIE